MGQRLSLPQENSFTEQWAFGFVQAHPERARLDERSYTDVSLRLLANRAWSFERFFGWRYTNLVTAFTTSVVFAVWLVALANDVKALTREDLFACNNLSARRKFGNGNGAVAAQFNIGIFLPSGQAGFQRRHVERKSVTRQETSEREFSDDVGPQQVCYRILNRNGGICAIGLENFVVFFEQSFKFVGDLFQGGFKPFPAALLR